jgi:hypothetical protein
MKSSQFHYPSFFGFLFFAICSGFLLLIGLIVGLSTLVTSVYTDQVNVQSTIIFATLSFTGILLGVATVISVMKFMRNPAVEVREPTSVSGVKIAAGIVTTGLVLWLGSWLQSNPSINWLALPLLTIPAVAIPIWLLLRLASKDIQPESRWRIWSMLGLSLSFTPFLLFTLEIVVIIIIFLAVVMYVVANPGLTAEIQTVTNQFRFMDPNSDEAIRMFVPYLTKPGVIASTLLLFSVIVPLLEEAFKPLGVWLLAGKLDSPAQGFSLGALCGAGFALVETLNNSAQTDEWASLLFMRIGTGAMHITTSALIGAAIVMAWRERRYLRLFATYLLGVFLHGLWNLLAITNGFSNLLVTYGQASPYQKMETFSLVGLGILTLTLIAILVVSNQKQPKEKDEEPSVTTTTAENNTDL